MKPTAPLFGLAALTAALALPPTARADRPLLSETADVADVGRCDGEAVVQRDRASAAASIRTTTLGFECGLTASTQLALGGSQAREGGVRARALQFTGKTVLGGDAEGMAYGLAYAWSVADAGDGWRHDALSLSGLASLGLPGGWRGHANLGVQRARGTPRHTTAWSLGVESSGAWWVAADVFGDDRSARPSFSSGVGAALGNATQLSLVWSTSGDRPRQRSTSVGLKHSF